MSLHYAINGKRYRPKYERPGRTKQSFKDGCDIHRIVAKAQKAGTLSHLEKHGAFYADVADAPQDIFEARDQLEKVNAIFADLPSELRNEFQNDPLEYLTYVNDPANRDQLDRLLPELAKPGRQNLDMSPRTPPGHAKGEPIPKDHDDTQKSQNEPKSAPEGSKKD